MSLAPAPVRRRDVKRFTDYCVTLRVFWATQQALFAASDLQRDLLQATAHKFFFDTNEMMRDHLILQICKLTDSATTKKHKDIYSNLTTKYLFENADFSKHPREHATLTRIMKRIDAFRARIVPARNKLIGHLDLEAVHARRAQGRASMRAWQQFWIDLEEFVSIMYVRYVDKRASFSLTGVGHISDVDQLVKALQESTYFRAALKDRALTQRLVTIAESSKYHAI